MVLELKKVVDKMEPYQHRFKHYMSYHEIPMPVTKNGEQYYLLKNDQIIDNLHFYYVINEENQVVGRFSANVFEKNCGLTYHIIPEYQNRGIGQLVLSIMVEDLFTLDVEIIRLHPTNERSAAIAMKNGFVPMHRKVEYYTLTRLDYQNRHKKNNL